MEEGVGYISDYDDLFLFFGYEVIIVIIDRLGFLKYLILVFSDLYF